VRDLADVVITVEAKTRTVNVTDDAGINPMREAQQMFRFLEAQLGVRIAGLRSRDGLGTTYWEAALLNLLALLQPATVGWLADTLRVKLSTDPEKHGKHRFAPPLEARRIIYGAQLPAGATYQTVAPAYPASKLTQTILGLTPPADTPLQREAQISAAGKSAATKLLELGAAGGWDELHRLETRVDRNLRTTPHIRKRYVDWLHTTAIPVLYETIETLLNYDLQLRNQLLPAWKPVNPVNPGWNPQTLTPQEQEETENQINMFLQLEPGRDIAPAVSLLEHATQLGLIPPYEDWAENKLVGIVHMENPPDVTWEAYLAEHAEYGEQTTGVTWTQLQNTIRHVFHRLWVGQPDGQLTPETLGTQETTPVSQPASPRRTAWPDKLAEDLQQHVGKTITRKQLEALFEKHGVPRTRLSNWLYLDAGSGSLQIKAVKLSDRRGVYRLEHVHNGNNGKENTL
jgi:hypothetical protein